MKVVVLNSGGFDSICMIHDVANNSNNEVHSLHFLYGARNEKQQIECVDNVCEKLGIENNIKIQLPKFVWTKGNFYNDSYSDDGSQYIEYRNLIFLSFAVSYAESIGAEKIYTAVTACNTYSDTSSDFFKGLNFFLKKSGIRIVTPFSKYVKADLIRFILKYDIKPQEYFSCDTPSDDGQRCGKCNDCLALDTINNHIIIDTPYKAFIAGGKNVWDTKFRELANDINYPYDSVTISLGGNADIVETSSRVDKWIKQGIKNFHFVNIVRFSDFYKVYIENDLDDLDCGVKVSVSLDYTQVMYNINYLEEISYIEIVDDFKPSNSDYIRDAIRLCNKLNIPVGVSFCPQLTNLLSMENKIKKYINHGVEDIRISLIQINGDEIDENMAFQQIISLIEEYPNALFKVYSLPFPLIERYAKKGEEIYSKYYSENLILDIKYFESYEHPTFFATVGMLEKGFYINY